MAPALPPGVPSRWVHPALPVIRIAAPRSLGDAEVRWTCPREEHPGAEGSPSDPPRLAASPPPPFRAGLLYCHESRRRGRLGGFRVLLRTDMRFLDSIHGIIDRRVL